MILFSFSCVLRLIEILLLCRFPCLSLLIPSWRLSDPFLPSFLISFKSLLFWSFPSRKAISPLSRVLSFLFFAFSEEESEQSLRLFFSLMPLLAFLMYLLCSSISSSLGISWRDHDLFHCIFFPESAAEMGFFFQSMRERLPSFPSFSFYSAVVSVLFRCDPSSFTCLWSSDAFL